MWELKGNNIQKNMCFRHEEELLEFLQETESNSTCDNEILLSDEKSEADYVLTEKVCI